MRARLLNGNSDARICACMFILVVGDRSAYFCIVDHDYMYIAAFVFLRYAYTYSIQRSSRSFLQRKCYVWCSYMYNITKVTFTRQLITVMLLCSCMRCSGLVFLFPRQYENIVNIQWAKKKCNWDIYAVNLIGQRHWIDRIWFMICLSNEEKIFFFNF